MKYVFYSKQELRDNCVEECVSLIFRLTHRSLLPSGEVVEPLTKLQIASVLHLTQTQMSRISNGLAVPSAPTFFRLQQLFKSRLEDGVV